MALVVSAQIPVGGALSETELDQLSDFLESLESPDALTLEGMDGLFSALVAGPQTVLPSEYLPVIWGGELPDENAFPSIEAANATLSLIMRHWNSIISEFEADGIHLPVVLEVETGEVPGREWARGFMLGVDFDRSGWNELFHGDDEGQLIVIPIVAGEVDPQWPHEPVTAEKSIELIGWMAAGLARSYRHFAPQRREHVRSAGRPAESPRRAAPKVGRNEPCPCGSGKKFKRCCGNPPPASH
jgi:uncharacterized protein